MNFKILTTINSYYQPLLYIYKEFIKHEFRKIWGKEVTTKRQAKNEETDSFRSQAEWYERQINIDGSNFDRLQ